MTLDFPHFLLSLTPHSNKILHAHKLNSAFETRPSILCTSLAGRTHPPTRDNSQPTDLPNHPHQNTTRFTHTQLNHLLKLYSFLDSPEIDFRRPRSENVRLAVRIVEVSSNTRATHLDPRRKSRQSERQSSESGNECKYCICTCRCEMLEMGDKATPSQRPGLRTRDQQIR
jgi:hypothetical protein